MLADVSSHAQPLFGFPHKKLQGSRGGVLHVCEEALGQEGAHSLGCAQLAFFTDLRGDAVVHTTLTPPFLSPPRSAL